MSGSPSRSALTRDELLVLLIEECGGVIQAATKCLRFGFDADHGTGYGPNNLALSQEAGDLVGCIDALGEHIDTGYFVRARKTKRQRAEEAKAKFGRPPP